MKLEKVAYNDLNARQRENFNFQKVSAVLADYGFVTLRLSDDWHGADFIALHISGEALRVQLKSRLTLDRKYQGKNLHVAFPDGGTWYLYPYDELESKILDATSIGSTEFWLVHGNYSYHNLPENIREILNEYRITGNILPMPG